MNRKVVPAAPASRTMALLDNRPCNRSVSLALAKCVMGKDSPHNARMIKVRLLMLLEPARVISPLKVVLVFRMEYMIEGCRVRGFGGSGVRANPRTYEPPNSRTYSSSSPRAFLADFSAFSAFSRNALSDFS